MAVVVVVRFSVASCSSSVSSDNSESLSRPVVGWSSGIAGLRGALSVGSVGGGDGDGELRESRERVERGIAVSNYGDGDGSGADGGQCFKDNKAYREPRWCVREKHRLGLVKLGHGCIIILSYLQRKKKYYISMVYSV